MIQQRHIHEISDTNKAALHPRHRNPTRRASCDGIGLTSPQCGKPGRRTLPGTAPSAGALSVTFDRFPNGQ